MRFYMKATQDELDFLCFIMRKKGTKFLNSVWQRTFLVPFMGMDLIIGE